MGVKSLSTFFLNSVELKNNVLRSKLTHIKRLINSNLILNKTVMRAKELQLTVGKDMCNIENIIQPTIKVKVENFK